MALIGRINHVTRSEKIGKVLDQIEEMDLEICLITDREFSTSNLSDIELKINLDEDGKISIYEILEEIEKAIKAEMKKSQDVIMAKYANTPAVTPSKKSKRVK